MQVTYPGFSFYSELNEHDKNTLRTDERAKLPDTYTATRIHTYTHNLDSNFQYKCNFRITSNNISICKNLPKAMKNRRMEVYRASAMLIQKLYGL